MCSVFCILLYVLTGCTEITGGKTTQPEIRIIGQDIVTENTDNTVYLSLDDAEKSAYKAIVEAAGTFSEIVQFDSPLTKEQIIKVFSLVYTQENTIFWLSSLASPRENGIKLNFRYSKEDTKFMQDKLSQTASIILTGMKSDLDDYGKIKYIHDYIVLNCDFTESGENANSAYGVLIDKKAQCEGYAFTFAYLAKKAGLNCVTVTGTTADGATHAWNKVEADGNFYNIDCTWDDPQLSYTNPGYIRYLYMLVPDRDIINITHFPNELFKAPDCTAFSQNYFTKEGLLFGNADAAIKTLTTQIQTCTVNKKTECEIRMDTQAAFDEVLYRLFEKNELSTIIETINKQSAFAITGVHNSHNEQLMTVHLSLEF
ncbi:MAG: hypothetical protein LBM87_03675 [Ruminococcus sp.]|jgi:hypothetical protein|nr:hypothetical protein [Ruminococcus sp.]